MQKSDKFKYNAQALTQKLIESEQKCDAQKNTCQRKDSFFVFH